MPNLCLYIRYLKRRFVTHQRLQGEPAVRQRHFVCRKIVPEMLLSPKYYSATSGRSIPPSLKSWNEHAECYHHVPVNFPRHEPAHDGEESTRVHLVMSCIRIVIAWVDGVTEFSSAVVTSHGKTKYSISITRMRIHLLPDAR